MVFCMDLETIGLESARYRKNQFFAPICGYRCSTYLQLGFSPWDSCEDGVPFAENTFFGLFRFPFGWIFRALGGFPVQRDKSHNLVESYVKVFQTNSDFAIVIAPEGTRKKVDHFKTGFYFIAKGAEIPIVLCKFDYHERVVDFMEVFVPGTEESADLAYIESRFRGARGKNREYNF